MFKLRTLNFKLSILIQSPELSQINQFVFSSGLFFNSRANIRLTQPLYKKNQ